MEVWYLRQVIGRRRRGGPPNSSVIRWKQRHVQPPGCRDDHDHHFLRRRCRERGRFHHLGDHTGVCKGYPHEHRTAAHTQWSAYPSWRAACQQLSGPVSCGFNCSRDRIGPLEG